MLKHFKNKKAFSMLELIFVIIILGIVSSIGAEVIAKTYETYIIQRAQYRASIKTELAATQIANRLSHAIPGTVVRKTSGALGLNAGSDINEAVAGDPNVLQWVAADADGFNSIQNVAGVNLPGWSGFADVDASTLTNIATPGSNLALTNTIRTNLGLTAANPQIYFPAESGLVSTPVTLPLAGAAMVLNPAAARIVEHYKLATSSYALEAAANGDLWLYFNFAPQINVAIPAANRVLLLRNVSTFQMRGDGQTIRFKICVTEDIGNGVGANGITICKEKAVF